MKKLLMSLALSALISWIFVGLILPAIVSALKPSLTRWEILSTTTFMVFLGLSLSFLTSAIALIYLSRELKFSRFAKFAVIAYGLSLMALFLICYLIVIVSSPEYYSQLTLFRRILSVPSAPAILVLRIGSIEPIWLGGSFLYYTILIGGFSNVKIKN